MTGYGELFMYTLYIMGLQSCAHVGTSETDVVI